MYILKMQDIDGNEIVETEPVTYETPRIAYDAAQLMFRQGQNVSRAIVEGQDGKCEAFTTNMFLNSIYNPKFYGADNKPVYGSYLGQLSHFYENYPLCLPYKTADYDEKLVPFYEQFPQLRPAVAA